MKKYSTKHSPIKVAITFLIGTIVGIAAVPLLIQAYILLVSENELKPYRCAGWQDDNYLLPTGK